jgi:hypothetical protein
MFPGKTRILMASPELRQIVHKHKMRCVAQEIQRPQNKGLPEDQRIRPSEQVKGQRLEQTPPVVFEAVKVPIAPVSPGFAPLGSLHADDERVYLVSDSVPVLLNLDSDFNSRPFVMLTSCMGSEDSQRFWTLCQPSQRSKHVELLKLCKQLYTLFRGAFVNRCYCVVAYSGILLTIVELNMEGFSADDILKYSGTAAAKPQGKLS